MVHYAERLFFTYAATTDIYTLSLHDALPISGVSATEVRREDEARTVATGEEGGPARIVNGAVARQGRGSEEHTAELEAVRHVVCRLVLEHQTRLQFQPGGTDTGGTGQDRGGR